MKLLASIILLGSFSLLISCTTSSQSPTQFASNLINKQTVTKNTNQTYPAKNPQKVALYINETTPHTAYRIIGAASVSKYNLLGMKREESTMHEMMKQLAASVGGDGLINFNSDETRLHANVIAFQKILI